jgi:plasmid stabilization system protein ParE
MNWVVRFESEADDEYQESLRKLEEAREGLGERFRVEVQHVLREIARDPYRFRKVHRDIRRAFAPTFHHWIYFTIDKKEIAVAAVFHTSRDPDTLRERGLL